MGVVTLTNAISLTITAPGAKAGSDGAALVGQAIALDGAGMLQSNGVLLPGISPTWTVLDAPGGSNPTLIENQGAIPIFTADAPGRYVVSVSTPTSQGISQDECIIDVYQVIVTSLLDGQFAQGTVNLQGSVAGPLSVQQLHINGVAAPLTGTTFQANNLPLTSAIQALTARLTLVSGQVLEHTISVINGVGLPIGQSADIGAATRLQGVNLDFIEAPIELILGALPLNTIFTAIPTVPIINSPPFLTASFTFTSATIDPDVDLDLFPSTSGGIGLSVTYTNLVITANVTGAIFG
jgi:hypothetical protein